MAFTPGTIRLLSDGTADKITLSATGARTVTSLTVTRGCVDIVAALDLQGDTEYTVEAIAGDFRLFPNAAAPLNPYAIFGPTVRSDEQVRTRQVTPASGDKVWAWPAVRGEQVVLVITEG